MYKSRKLHIFLEYAVFVFYDKMITKVLCKQNSGAKSMHKLIILRGNSGSGKTTIAKELQKKFGRNTMLISQDVVRRDMLNVKDGPDNPALSLMKELLKYGSEHSEVVVLEGILVADWYQELFELAVYLYGSDIYAYYFDLPFEETLTRHQTKPNCNEFGEEAMRRWWKEKDYSTILSERSITKEMDKDSILEAICKDILS